MTQHYSRHIGGRGIFQFQMGSKATKSYSTPSILHLRAQNFVQFNSSTRVDMKSDVKHFADVLAEDCSKQGYNSLPYPFDSRYYECHSVPISGVKSSIEQAVRRACCRGPKEGWLCGSVRGGAKKGPPLNVFIRLGVNRFLRGGLKLNTRPPIPTRTVPWRRLLP